MNRAVNLILGIVKKMRISNQKSLGRISI